MLMYFLNPSGIGLNWFRSYLTDWYWKYPNFVCYFKYGSPCSYVSFILLTYYYYGKYFSIYI